MIPGKCTDLLPEETPGKLQLGDRLTKPVGPVVALNGPLFHTWVGSHSTSGREKEGNKERTGF